MIKINRPAKVPAKLTKDGVTQTHNNVAAYNLAPRGYISGVHKFKILPKIYGHKSVKSSLKKSQHNKCCFCEKNHVEEHGAVEHFRPKGGFKINRTQKTLTQPGYYWLGYSWDNLFYVCSFCNGANHKGNLFPLVNEAIRATSHNGNINAEDPYLIDPSVINPRDHIYFKGELAYGSTKYGSETINICGLNRESLFNKRKEHIEHLDMRLFLITKSADQDSAEVKKAKAYLKDAVLPSAEFSAMAANYLSQFNIQQ